MSRTSLEQRTREIGREVFARLGDGSDGVGVGSAKWFDEKMMALSMRDEALKVQLFRFVDALPLLRTPAQINRHLREYLLEAGRRLPGVVRAAAKHIPDDGMVGGMIASAARGNAHRLARRFIAGTTLPETLRTIEDLRRQRMAFTVDLLGEAVLSESEAERYQRQYLHFIDGLAATAKCWPRVGQIDDGPAGPLPVVNVSVKLSSLFSQFDPIDPAATSRAVRERLRPILRAAKSRGAFVNIDMEQSSYKDATLQIFEEVFGEAEFRDWPDVGIAIQAYLKSCGDDLARLAAFAEKRGTPVWVRLVKGAYWDYETVVSAQQGWESPVFPHKPETDANFERQTEFLIERAEVLKPAIGSHNVRSVAHALALAERRGLPPRSVEFQMLYGMADPIKAALVRMGQRVRVYTPFGELLPGMAYLVRRLLENTSNQSFLRAGFLEKAPVEELLMNPLEKIRQARTKAPGEAKKGNRDLSIPFRNEPLTDFSVEANRDLMEAALREAGGQMGRTFPFVVNGREYLRTETVESTNPSHASQVVGRVAKGTAEDARLAVEAARDAFAGWRDTSVERRADSLFRCGDVLRRRRFEIAAWEVYECGKQWREADADLAEAIDFCDYYAREMLRLSFPQTRNVPGEENEYFYEPRGVAVVIAPWNFPLAILCGMTAAALAAGNTVVMKPAEQSAVVGSLLMQVFQEAGLPAGVVNLLHGVGEELGPTLVNHPDVSVIAFTGSRTVGLSINEQASRTPPGQEHVKRVITEMGGKNAVIVDDDADLDEAVHSVVASAFGYAGQKCSACSRAVVLDSVYDVFLARLVEMTRSLRVGPAEDPGAAVGPVIDAEARERVLRYVETGKREARLAYGADLGPLAREGHYVGPHVFADVRPDATIAQEEIFGPVLAVIRARDLTEALKIANGTQYALTGGLHSRSPANIERVRREFRVGNLYINRKITGALVDRQPFGGFKLSGTGSKAGGPDYLLQFLVPRVVTENTLRHGFAPVQDATAGTLGGVGE